MITRRSKLLRGRNPLRKLTKPHWEVRAHKTRQGTIILEINRIAPINKDPTDLAYTLERRLFEFDPTKTPMFP
jgi:hypothetical protein